MALRSETLRVAGAGSPGRIHPAKTASAVLVAARRAASDWIRRGQLGPARSVEIGRYTGARC
jgi:hypothetical protein